MLHIAIQKWHWSPEQLAEWLMAEQSVKAFYYASVDSKARHDKVEADRLKRKGRK